MKIKIIWGFSVTNDFDGMEKEVNEWLEKHSGITVIDIKFIAFGRGKTFVRKKYPSDKIPNGIDFRMEEVPCASMAAAIQYQE